ncbi:MAG: hypothetical protein ABDH91_09085 [Bacteroidia bacterium]
MSPHSETPAATPKTAPPHLLGEKALIGPHALEKYDRTYPSGNGWVLTYRLQTKEGCTDETAANYRRDCTHRKGEICEFDYTIAFWFDTAFARTLERLEVDTLYLRISNLDQQGNSTQELWHSYYRRSEAFLTEPTCEDSRVKKFHFRYRLGDIPMYRRRWGMGRCSSCSGGYSTALTTPGKGKSGADTLP